MSEYRWNPLGTYIYNSRWRLVQIINYWIKCVFTFSLEIEMCPCLN